MGHRDTQGVNNPTNHGYPAGYRTVVFVDNDDSIRTALGRLFESNGFAVATYASGAELKAAWDAVPPPSNLCLILDMRMPGQSGLELFRELRSMGFEPPVVFLSGESQTQEVIHSLKEGAIDFLLKPVEYDTLVTSINRAIEQSMKQTVQQGQDDDMHAPFDQLTLREKEVMRLVLKGMRGQKVADALGITLRTVKMHRSNLMNKVEAEGVAHLLALYHRAHR